MPSTLTILAGFSGLAFAGAAAGAWFTSLPDVSRRTIPLSGAMLILVSLFWILPELTAKFGVAAGAALMAGGVALVALIDRFVYPVCPSCSHTHNHDACSTRLHGFAWPLVIAAVLHSLFDGWTFAAGYERESARLLSLGVAVHKLPEGLALGVILRAAMKQRAHAIAWAAVTQIATLVGGVLEILTADQVGHGWISALLAVGGGMFLYLGAHAMHGEWKRRLAQRSAELS